MGQVGQVWSQQKIRIKDIPYEGTITVKLNNHIEVQILHNYATYQTIQICNNLPCDSICPCNMIQQKIGQAFSIRFLKNQYSYLFL